MDPYLNSIPDEGGEEIKKRIRARDGSDTEEQPTKRARSDTSALLPPGNDEPNLEDPPKPESDLNNYNHERLQKGLRYVNEAAKRKVTPRTQEFLKLHKDAYKVALEGQAPAEAARAVVQAMDQVYYSAAFYLKARSPEEYDRLMSYLKLRRLELLANYGDYLGQELQEIRADLKAAAIGASSDVREVAIRLGPPKSWIDIAEQLDSEDMSNLRQHVDVACGILGIDSNHMLWLIKEWAERNRFFHNKIRLYISDCHFNSLAGQIHRDLKELQNVAPDQETAKQYERVLINIRDEYFDVMNPHDPEHWIANEKARKLLQEKFERNKKRAQKRG